MGMRLAERATPGCCARGHLCHVREGALGEGHLQHRPRHVDQGSHGGLGVDLGHAAKDERPAAANDRDAIAPVHRVHGLPQGDLREAHEAD